MKISYGISILASFGILFAGLSGFASVSLLTVERGDGQLEGVTLAKSGVVHLADQDVQVVKVGAGLRNKKVLFAQLKVYVAQLFVSEPAKFVRTRDGALKSLDQIPMWVMQLSTLRSVEAERMQTSFREALSVNAVDLKNPANLQFLDVIIQSGLAGERKTLTFVAYKNADGSEVLIFEDTLGRQSRIVGGKDFVKGVFSIWLGVAMDEETDQMKKSIIENK